MDSSMLLLIPLLPLLGFLLNGLLGNRLGPKFVSVVGCLAPIAAFVITFRFWSGLEGGEAITHHAFDWISIGSLHVPFAFLFDPLSACMCLVITGIGSLIHLYSTGYMKGDPSYGRFFAYLNLFTAFMLVLVLADNLLLLFVGWEGVGLCSYLLIGFWHKDNANNAAGMKAFIFNRIGDFGVLIGIFLLFAHLGTIDTRGIAEALPGFLASTEGAGTIILAITLLLFLGCTGKSAQIPLYPWLPDAMAGPTPVSALIHAATMVTSGVYLCCRMQPLFAQSPETLAVIAGVGACTALLAALIALTQNDIKKVLAYSTVSQLGYMFYAIGVGAFSAAFFHVVTHAFFKALLFLGSGSVIHAMHHEQDMRKMGGLRHQLPFTHVMFLIGTAAIAGVPVLAGFFSKDEILFSGYFNAFTEHGHGGGLDQIFWIMAFVTAGLTAFYMLRLVALTFWGESRVEPEVASHVHEPSGWMPFALFVLAGLSILGGFMNVPNLAPFTWVTDPSQLAQYIGLYHPHTGVDEHQLHTMEYTAMFFSVAVGALGLFLAWYFYGKGRAALQGFVEGAGRPLVKLSENKFYVDELYDAVIIGPFQLLSYTLWLVVDRMLIDGFLVGGSALLVRSTGDFIRRMQSGFIPAYLLTFACGALVLLFVTLLLIKGAGS